MRNPKENKVYNVKLLIRNQKETFSEEELCTCTRGPYGLEEKCPKHAGSDMLEGKRDQQLDSDGVAKGNEAGRDSRVP